MMRFSPNANAIDSQSVSSLANSSQNNSALPLNLRGRKIGLVAGWGSFPVEAAERCKQEGAQLYVVGLIGHADPQLATLADQFQWMGVAKLGGHMRFFRRHGVTQVALAGKLFKDKLLYHGRGAFGLLPDLTCLRALADIFLTHRQSARDDSILGSVVKAYARIGIEMISVNQIAPGLLVSEQLVAGDPPTSRQWSDIEFGWHVAKQMGALDIGQSITVKDQTVLAVEAIEGTDALIQRTGELCPRGGFSLIKVAKPQQDLRFDLPTIGPQTVRNVAEAGGKMIVVEAGMTILVEREETIATAKRLGVSIVALSQSQVESQPQSLPSQAA